MADRVVIEWSDGRPGGFMRQANSVASLAALPAYLSALRGASNAQQLLSVVGPAVVPVSAVVVAQYPSVADRAVLVFQTVPGGRVVVAVPAPVAALFTATQDTVDPTDPTGLIAAVIASLGDASGNAITAFVQGLRADSRKDV